MSSNLLDHDPAIPFSAPKRPVFLTVLCILSFVGIGLSLFGVGYTLFSYSLNAGSPLLPEYATQRIFYSGIISVSSEVLMLVGVIMMWKLKRTGYFLYVAGQVIIMIAPILMFGFTGFQLITVAFAILFIVLYGANYRTLVR